MPQFMKKSYPTGKADLMTAFMLRSQQLTAAGGTWGMINLPSWMALKSFEQLRLDLLKEQRISSLVHLGRGIFGSDFGSVAFVVDNADPDGAVGVYRRLFEQHVDVRSVETIEQLFLDPHYNRFTVRQKDLGTIPGSPLAYWLSENMRRVFANYENLSTFADARQGLATADNDRFLRLWWEVADRRTAFGCTSRQEAKASGARWFPFNKGGEFRRWYGNQEYVVNWEDDGRDIRTFTDKSSGRVKSRPQNIEKYFSPSVSWSDVSSGSAAFRYYTHGNIFGNTGHSLFANRRVLYAIIGILNSFSVSEFLKVLAPTMHFDIGYVSQVPIPDIEDEQADVRPELMINNSQRDWNVSETSHDFVANPLVSQVLTTPQ